MALWTIAWLYYTLLKFKVIIFDYPSREGSNINEPGFFSLPMTEKHPLHKKVKEVYGEPKTLPLKIFRPVIFSHSMPVGLGITYPDEQVPANIEPYTLPFSQLFIEDWEAILGNMSHTAYNLLSAAVRRLRGEREASVLDLIRTVEMLAEEKETGFLADITGLPAATPELRIGSRAFDKKSVPRLLSDLQNLANSGFILPSYVAGERVRTNIDVETLLRQNDWLVFNFSPAIPQSLVFGTIRFIMRHLLWVRDKHLAMVFPEISLFGPRQIPEEKEWFLRPMRDLLTLAATQHAKAGKIILADTQQPRQLDETLQNSFRYRLHFGRPDKGELEQAVRSEGVINAESLLSPQNLRLVLDERNHYPIFVTPTGQGCIVKGDTIPPFRTHVTAEGTYDTVYKNSKDRPPMKDLMTEFQYVIQVVEQSHIRNASIQNTEKQAKVQEEAKETDATKNLILGLTKVLAEKKRGKDPEPYTFPMLEWKRYMMKRLGMAETSLIRHLRNYEARGLVFINRKPRGSTLAFEEKKLEPYEVPEEPVADEKKGV